MGAEDGRGGALPGERAAEPAHATTTPRYAVTAFACGQSPPSVPVQNMDLCQYTLTYPPFVCCQFDDVLIYLSSIEAYFPSDVTFHYNYAIARAAAGKYKEVRQRGSR